MANSCLKIGGHLAFSLDDGPIQDHWGSVGELAITASLWQITVKDVQAKF
jgi:hypothetical protein